MRLYTAELRVRLLGLLGLFGLTQCSLRTGASVEAATAHGKATTRTTLRTWTPFSSFSARVEMFLSSRQSEWSSAHLQLPQPQPTPPP